MGRLETILKVALIKDIAFRSLHNEEDTKWKRRSGSGGAVVGVGGGETEA